MTSKSIKEALRGKEVPLSFSVPKTWEPIMINLLDELSKLPEWDYLQILQVKSKFGELRFYYDGDPTIHQSGKIKELVGKAVSECQAAFKAQM